MGHPADCAGSQIQRLACVRQVGERQFYTGNLLAVFMAFAGQQHHVMGAAAAATA